MLQGLRKPVFFHVVKSYTSNLAHHNSPQQLFVNYEPKRILSRLGSLLILRYSQSENDTVLMLNSLIWKPNSTYSIKSYMQKQRWYNVGWFAYIYGICFVVCQLSITLLQNAGILTLHTHWYGVSAAIMQNITNQITNMSNYIWTKCMLHKHISLRQIPRYPKRNLEIYATDSIAVSSDIRVS